MRNQSLSWVDLRVKLGDTSKIMQFITLLRVRDLPQDQVLGVKHALHGITDKMIGIRQYAAALLLKWMQALVKYHEHLNK